jgi:hypothetical protein
MRLEPHIERANNEKIIKFMNLELVENMNGCYKLWDDIVLGLGWSDLHDCSCIQYGRITSINSMKFHKDWNWLMPVVKKIQTDIFIPMDSDWNNMRHIYYQQIKEQLRFHLEKVEFDKLYETVIEIITWWDKVKDLK